MKCPSGPVTKSAAIWGTAMTSCCWTSAKRRNFAKAIWSTRCPFRAATSSSASNRPFPTRLPHKVPCHSSLYLPAESPSGARNPPRLLIMPGLLRPTREGVSGEAPFAIREGACGLRKWCKLLVLKFDWSFSYLLAELFSLFSPLNFLTELSSFYYSLYPELTDRKSTRLNSSHQKISY